ADRSSRSPGARSPALRVELLPDRDELPRLRPHIARRGGDDERPRGQVDRREAPVLDARLDVLRDDAELAGLRPLLDDERALAVDEEVGGEAQDRVLALDDDLDVGR